MPFRDFIEELIEALKIVKEVFSKYESPIVTTFVLFWTLTICAVAYAIYGFRCLVGYTGRGRS